MPLHHLESNWYRLGCKFISLKWFHKDLAKEKERIISSFENRNNHVIINHTNSDASAFKIFLLLGSSRATLKVIARNLSAGNNNTISLIGAY